MPKIEEYAEVEVNGRRYRDWTGISVSRSYENPVSTFTLSAASPAESGNNWSDVKLKVGDRCKLSLAGSLVLTGVIATRQALCICALSRAPNAPRVRRALIDAFMELRHRDRAVMAPPAAIPVRAHRRTPRKRAMFDASQHGRGCVVLDRPVYFDAGRYPADGELALVVFGDGRLGVVPMPKQAVDPYRALEPGFVMVETSGPYVRGIRIIRERAALIGAVTSPAGHVPRIR